MKAISVGDGRLELVQGDITSQDTDAIVNAANNSLRGGGGVDGAIHRAGGAAILAECINLGGCATGDAKITSGGLLRARYVIHTVGPIYAGGGQGEADLLASAYRRCIEVAVDNRLSSLAFPSISTGAYGFPLAPAAAIALRTVMQGLRTNPSIVLARFVLFSAGDLEVYSRTLAALAPQAGA